MEDPAFERLLTPRRSPGSRRGDPARGAEPAELVFAALARVWRAPPAPGGPAR